MTAPASTPVYYRDRLGYEHWSLEDRGDWVSVCYDGGPVAEWRRLGDFSWMRTWRRRNERGPIPADLVADLPTNIELDEDLR